MSGRNSVYLFGIADSAGTGNVQKGARAIVHMVSDMGSGGREDAECTGSQGKISGPSPPPTPCTLAVPELPAMPIRFGRALPILPEKPKVQQQFIGGRGGGGGGMSAKLSAFPA